MMGHREKLVGCLEHDALTRWKRWHKWKPKERKEIKQKFHRRYRRVSKQNLIKELQECEIDI